MGSASAIQATIEALHKRSPDELRSLLLSDEWLKLALTAFHKRLEDAERDAVRLYFEAVKLVNGRDSSAALTLLAGLGVRDETEAYELIARAKGVSQATPDDAYRLAKDIVRSRLKADPRERRRLMQELFGEIEAPTFAQDGPEALLTSPDTTNGVRGATRAVSVRSTRNGNGSHNHESEY